MKNNRKKLVLAALVAGGATVAACAAAISHTITKKLMQVALDRKQPRMSNKLQSSMRGMEGMDLAVMIESNREAREALEQKCTQVVEMTAFDGTRLVGHYLPAEKPKRLIVAMHGWRSSWSNDFAGIAEFWYKSGCSVLYVEQRGQNNSGGDYMGFGLLERYDCRDWAKWLAENVSDTLPIYLCGISMGATTVMMSCSLTLPENVRGVMADCGFTSPAAIWRQIVEKNFRLSYKVRAATVERICRQKLNVGAEEISCPAVLRESQIPVMFIHGSDDHFVPVEMTYENYKACAAPKRLLIVPGAEHGLSYCVDQAAYEQAMSDFWRDFDA